MKKAIDNWARRIKADNEIPDSFQNFFSTSVDNQALFPYTIFAPPERGYHWKSTPKLLCLKDDGISIAEKVKKQIKITHFSFRDIYYLETGTLLLHSWLKINGIVDGRLTTVMVEYNTVVEEIFKPLVTTIRANINYLDQTELSSEKLKQELHKFDYLIKENFKYMNFGKRSLIPGEQVERVILQPDIRLKYLRFFQRLISYTHLIILTDHELIVIKDDNSLKIKKQARYGGVWQFIPLHKIDKIRLNSNLNNGLIELDIITPDDKITTQFTMAQKEDLELLVAGFEQIKTPPRRECV